MPKYVLSTIPTTFNRAAELGIELSLAGHYHATKSRSKSLDTASAARFISDYIAAPISGRSLARKPATAP